MSATLLIATAILGQATWTPTGPKVVVTMSNGKSFTIATDSKGSPKTVARVLELVKEKFYDGQRFHRVEPWVVQWGAPQSKKGIDSPGVGNGGSGKSMAFESSKAKFDRGVVGVASTGARLGGDSQLFILTKPAMHLNGDYAVVGKVISGMDVVDKIKLGDKITSIKVAK